MAQGDVWWAEFPEPVDSAPGVQRPVMVVQGDAFNRSRIALVVCVPLTNNLRWADAPGNVTLTARQNGLKNKSVTNVSQPVTLNRSVLDERVGRLLPARRRLILQCIDVVLGR